MSTQNPVLVFDFPALIEAHDGDSTVNRVPDRLNVPFQVSDSATLVGRSNPTVHFEIAEAEEFLTTKVPHQPSRHVVSKRKATLNAADVGVGVGLGDGELVGLEVGVAVAVGVGVGVAVAVAVGVGVGVGVGVVPVPDAGFQ